MELPSTKTAQVDAQSEEWFASYAEPSHRVRHRVRNRRTRTSRRQKLHTLNTVMMIVSLVLVGAMTAYFYAVLTR
jgi:hypothetical protein